MEDEMKNKIIQILFSLLLLFIALFIPFKNVFVNFLLYFTSYIFVGFEVIKEYF